MYVSTFPIESEILFKHIGALFFQKELVKLAHIHVIILLHAGFTVVEGYLFESFKFPVCIKHIYGRTICFQVNLFNFFAQNSFPSHIPDLEKGIKITTIMCAKKGKKCFKITFLGFLEL